MRLYGIQYLQDGTGRKCVRLGHGSQVPQCGHDYGGHECGRDTRVSTLPIFCIGQLTYFKLGYFEMNLAIALLFHIDAYYQGKLKHELAIRKQMSEKGNMEKK